MSVLPLAYPRPYEIIPLTGDRYVLGFDGADIYISNGKLLEKTSDFGKTFTTVYTFASGVRMLELTPDNGILVITADSKIWKSVDSGATFVNVFSPTGMPLNNLGFNVYDKFVLVPSYSAGNCVYFSNDYGNAGSWKTLITVTHPDSDHCHSAVFDPYENIIWCAWGDGVSSDIILLTDDFGKSWHTLPPGTYLRATNIMCLPDSVFFGTDEHYFVGAYKHERPISGSMQADIFPKLYWTARKNQIDTISAVTWATRPHVEYAGKDSIAYWGYRLQNNNGILPAAIYATQGDRVYPVWAQDKIADGVNANGIYGVWGSKDTLVADLRSIYKDGDGTDQEKHILKVTLPTVT